MQTQNTIRPGMRVLGSDGAELGVVEQVLASPDGTSARLLLSGGQFRVPTDVINYVGGNEVQIKMSAATARGTAWGEVPAGYTQVASFPWSGSALGETERITVQRYEEDLKVGKQIVETDTIRIQKRVIEEPQTINVDVLREEYHVERVPVDRPWQQGDDSPRTEGDIIIIPVVTEKLEVIRRRVVTEELRLTRRVVSEPRQVTDTVRKEVVEVTGPVTGDVPRVGGV